MSKISPDGKRPIMIRVTKDRKSKYIFLEWIDEKHWDIKNSKVKSSYPNSARLNHLILKRLTEANDLVLEAEAGKKDYNASQITKVVKQETSNTSFFQFAESFLQDLKAEKQFTREVSDRGHITNFKRFRDEIDLSFQDIDASMLRKYKTYLIGQRGVKERTAMNALVVIRTIFNRAIEAKLVDQKFYPFGKNKIRIKFPETLKIGLEENELLAMEELDLKEGSPIWHARNVFLTSFYLAGMRVSDLLRLKWSDINGDRLYYQMGKNDKVDSLKLPGKVIAILEFYKSELTLTSDYIFPELKKADQDVPADIARKIKTADRKFNDYLLKIAKSAKIHKDISMHIARHSFGNIAGDRISPQMLQKLYRHTSLTTTIGYQKNFIFKDADEALDTVITF